MKHALITAAVVTVLAGGSAALAQSGSQGTPAADTPRMVEGAGPGAGDCGRHAGRRARRGGPDLDRLAIVLDLTDEQKAGLESAFAEQRAEREAMRAERQAMREAMRESMQARIAEVLSPEQQAKLEALREMRGDRGHGERHRHGRGHWRGKESGSAS